MSTYLYLMDRVDLWKKNALSLQLQLRDRFRVAVDQHRLISDADYSHRWRLNRKKVAETPLYRNNMNKKTVSNAEEESTIIRMLQAVAVPAIGNACHVFMHGLNRVHVYGAEKLHLALLNRPKNKPLITVSNHVASIDDPFLIASLLPPNILLDARNLRWTLCASDRCFKNPVTSAFFRCVKVLPVDRGDGVYQKGMDGAISKLNSGGWVHIFPEGSRSRDGGKTMGPTKRGVGRLILDADNIPVVIPFVHNGMQEIMPIGGKFPRIGKTVTVLIGDPILFDDILNAEEAQHVSRGRLYDAVSSRIGHRLQYLKVQVDKLAQEHAAQVLNHLPMNSTERATMILQQLDWDSFGMGGCVLSEDNKPSPEQEIQFSAEVRISISQPEQQLASSDHSFRRGFSYQGGVVSRIRGCMDRTELMGFAARGLFMNHDAEESRAVVREVGPLKAWKHFLEANLLKQLNPS